MCIFSSSTGALAAGFTSIPWSDYYDYAKDDSARLFALTNEYKVFKPSNPSIAVTHGKSYGPVFSQALGLYLNPLNITDGGICNTLSSNDYGEYDVDQEENEASVLTGSNVRKNGDKRFTCVELEVFALS